MDTVESDTRPVTPSRVLGEGTFACLKRPDGDGFLSGLRDHVEEKTAALSGDPGGDGEVRF